MGSFSFKEKKGNDSHSEAIKWTRANAHCEVLTMTLKFLNLAQLVPHAIELRSKILTTVGTNVHKGPSLCEVFLHTLSPVLGATWERNNQDADNHPAIDNSKAVPHFEEQLHEFIEIHD